MHSNHTHKDNIKTKLCTLFIDEIYSSIAKMVSSQLNGYKNTYANLAATY